MSSQADQQRRMLAEMGVDVWLLRQKTGKTGNTAAFDSSDNAVYALSSLQNEVQSCQRCSLSQSRTQTVFGSGSANADLLLIGEAPGAEEDRKGLPFVGKAGRLLDAMLFAIGFVREQVYICNVLKCRPPNNRDPQANEVESCAPFLNAQIGIVSPKVILALGRFAAHRLLQTEAPVYKMRETINVLPGTDIPVVVTYHPASLLRNPMQKAQSWNDLCKVRQLLEKAET